MSKLLLSSFAYNVYSQFGEDGIIAKIYEIIKPRNRVCVEFGAWDGVHCSNTANLWHNGWKGILIEAEKTKYDQLITRTKCFDCVCINEKVGLDKDSSIEAILVKRGIELSSIDLLSIDIDSDDYYIFESLVQLHPQVLICEYNPTIPANCDVFAEQGNNYGCSVSALTRVASSKGYYLISVTDTNCIFVSADIFTLFDEYETRLEIIRIDKYLSYVTTSYSGEYAILSHESFGFPYGLSSVYQSKLNGI